MILRTAARATQRSSEDLCRSGLLLSKSKSQNADFWHFDLLIRVLPHRRQASPMARPAAASATQCALWCQRFSGLLLNKSENEKVKKSTFDFSTF